MLGDGVEPLVHRALQLRLRLGEQLAHGLDPRAQFDDALVGELRRGGLLGRELCRAGSATGAALPPDEDGEARRWRGRRSGRGRRGGRFP